MNNIEELNVNENWKKVFHAIQLKNGGNFFDKDNPEFLQLDPAQKKEMNLKINNFGTAFSSYFFGPLYYLFKGMWLKAFLIFAIYFLVGIAFELFTAPEPVIRMTALVINLFFAYTAPYNYYRLKVLKTQW